MAACGIVLVGALAVGIYFRKHHILGAKKQVCRILLAAAVLGVLAGIAGNRESVLKNQKQLERRAAGEGDYEAELEFYMDEAEEGCEYDVVVPERQYTREAAEELLEAAWQEIQIEFPGENESVNEIRGQVMIQENYQNGAVLAEWTFADSKIVSEDGTIIAEEIPESGILTNAWIDLYCGDFARAEEIPFVVFPTEKSEKEQLLADIADALAEQQADEDAYIFLPEKVGEHTLVWGEKNTYLPEKILLLGAVIAFMMPLLEVSRQKEERQKREQKLTMEYPDMVSKLTLLLAAGMTVQGAWRRIVSAYEKKRKVHAVSEMPAYEEMLSACHELESGIGEEQVYERFGERCGQIRYRRLGNLLTQNLKKGSQGIVKLLETEVADAFEERKNMARRYGEEAGTKLLIPMLLMFGIVLMILIYPALVTFQF
jgi:hypothetical protein